MRLNNPPFSYIPLLPILAGVVAGVLFGRFVTWDLWISAGIMTVAGLAAIALRRSIVAELLLSMALGAVSVSVSFPRQFDTQPDKATEMTGIVTQVSLDAGRQSARVSVHDNAGDFSAMITYPEFIPLLEAGDKIRFSGTYSLPRRDVDLPLEDDLSDFYFNERISLLCYVPKGRLQVTERSANPLYTLHRMRARVVDTIYSSGLKEEVAIFLAAVLTGDTSGLTATRRQEYATAGVAHILALSGAHVAIIAAVVSALLFPLLLAGHRRLRWWLTIIVLWGYAVFTGMSPSVCRAVIMASAVLLALILDRPRSSLNALSLAAILILLFSPLSLFNAGFQLSFAATLCIILFSPKLMPQPMAKSRWRNVWSIAAVTLAATLGTMPLVAWHFHSVPLFFFVANVVAVAVMPLMMSGGLLLVLLLLAGVEPGWLISALDFVYSLFDGTVRFVASLPAASFGGIYFSGWLLLPMYLSLAFFGVWLCLRRWNYLLLAGCTLLFTVGVYAATLPRYADGEAYMLRSMPDTSMALHHGDTLSVITTAPVHTYAHYSLVIAERYRDYIATRGVRHIELLSPDSAVSETDAMLQFGRHRMIVAHLMRNDGVAASRPPLRSDYCLVTAKWYGDPVALYHSVNADTIVLSTDINRRRRERYYRELSAAGVPVIDLGKCALSSP